MNSRVVYITQALLDAGKSQSGDWSRRQLDLLGIGWPPPKDWQRNVIGLPIWSEHADLFLGLKEYAARKRKNKPKAKVQVRDSQRGQSNLAATLEDDVRSKARGLGIALVVKHPHAVSRRRKSKMTRFQHWMFNDAATGERLMDYWPSTGRFYDRQGRRGQVVDPWQALEQARRACTPLEG